MIIALMEENCININDRGIKIFADESAEEVYSPVI